MFLPSATSRQHGVTFYNQWKQAFKYRPKIVILTWWNEWVAQRQPNGQFVDLYTPEYSRDLEPMKGGFGDQYYQWMIQYIAAYKGTQDLSASCRSRVLKTLNKKLQSVPFRSALFLLYRTFFEEP